MSNNPDAMLDLETYSDHSDAAIASIGAVHFDISTRSVFDEFYVVVDAKSCKDAGLHFSRETLDWWKAQSKEARDAIRLNAIPLSDALDKFEEWVKGSGSVCCWQMFDVPILSNAYKKLGRKVPWKYWDTTDCHSIAKLLGKARDIDRTKGVHHNALDDAKVQAKFIIDILNEKQ